MSEIRAKNIVTKSKLPEVDYCFNPYVGCTHRCSYCYARFMGRFTGHAGERWGSYLDWKINAPELLTKEAPKIKKDGGTVILGSVTDCYQPIEKKLELTRKCLEIFLEYQIPISILTKNALVIRDLDLLSQFEYCELGVSLSILDEKQRKIIEPGASSPQDRIDVLKKAFSQNINTYAFLGPIHPFLTNIKDVFSEIYPYIHFIMGEVPNLRCGNWEDLVNSLIQLNIDSEEYKRISKSADFYRESNNLVKKLCEEHSIDFRGIFQH